MGFPKHIYRQANSILLERRHYAEEIGYRQKMEIYSAIPQLQSIEKQLSEIGRNLIASVAAKNGNAREIVEILKQKSLALQEQRSELLREAGVPEDYLQPQYSCKICCDSGYVNNQRCECFQKLLREIASQELGGTDLQKFTFDNFNLSFYNDEVPNKNGTTPRVYMESLKNFCENYSKNFIPENSTNLLFVGGTGLGKTHMSLAIAREVIERGHGVIYASVQNLMAKLEDERFNNNFNFNNNSDEAELKYMSMVMSSDLLILDDLGTEFLTQFINSSIYNIVNTRIIRQKPTIISTNLTAEEIQKRYSDRLLSRLFGNYKTCNFIGKDIRIINATQRVDK